MITIHKYQFELNPNIEIGMHENAKVLDVQLQGDHWTMWVMEDTDKPKVTRKFKAYWTGEELNEMDIKRTHIATLQDTFVWHIFE